MNIAMPVSSPPLVDTHVHVFRRDLPGLANGPKHFRRDYTVDDLAVELDAAGVKYAAIAAASFLGDYCDYTLDSLRRHQRLRATVVVDPAVSESRLRELDSAGVVGIRLAVGNMREIPDLASSTYRKLLARVAALDWHVHLFARPEQLPMLLAELESSEVNVVLDHFGIRGHDGGPGSDSFDSVLRSLKNGRTWVKLSAPYWSESSDHQELAALLMAECGPRRLLWASDWPFIKLDGDLAYRQAVDWLAQWLPDPAVRQQVDLNALELYRFDRST